MRSFSKHDWSIRPEDPECKTCRLPELLSTLHHAPSVSGISYFTRVHRHGFWLLQSARRSHSRVLLTQLHLVRETAQCLPVPVPGGKRNRWKLLDKILHWLQLVHDLRLPPVRRDLQQSTSPAEPTRYGPQNLFYYCGGKLLVGIIFGFYLIERSNFHLIFEMYLIFRAVPLP